MACDRRQPGSGTEAPVGVDGNCMSFKAGKEFVRTLDVGSARAWNTSGIRGNHVFHIHVNPFQIARKFVDWSTGELGKQLVWKIHCIL